MIFIGERPILIIITSSWRQHSPLNGKNIKLVQSYYLDVTDKYQVYTVCQVDIYLPTAQLEDVPPKCSKETS